MQKLKVRKIEVIRGISLRDAKENLTLQTQLQKIDKLNWKNFSYAPKVNFRIAHTGKEIWLMYEVLEKYIRALETRTNGDVYKDSTVEFFISTGGKNYYNFEFSCIGTIHLAYGPGRGKRQRIDPAVAEKIKIETSLGSKPFEEKSVDFPWDIFIRIPTECFAFDNIKSFSGLAARGNFYKCGDATSLPHYISWNPIDTIEPDYHSPEFFGELEFE